MEVLDAMNWKMGVVWPGASFCVRGRGVVQERSRTHAISNHPHAK